MTQRHIKAAYSLYDPAHAFDGLFVPTKGKKRGRLLVEMRQFKDTMIGFQGFEQLGADDQSMLLAITAQLGIDGLVIDADPAGNISKQLRLDLKIDNDDGAKVASRKTSLRSLLIDAGHHPDTSTEKAYTSLNRLANAQIREYNQRTGFDRRCNLISTSFNRNTGETYIATNPRLASAVFRGHYIKVSLFERNKLETEAAKILHCWLCSNVRLGYSLGNGNGARIDTLAPHVWGVSGWESASKKVKSVRRGQLSDALDEIADNTKSLHDGHNTGWVVDRTSGGIVLVSRPKDLPFIEGEIGISPSEFHEAMTEPSFEEDPDFFKS